MTPNRTGFVKKGGGGVKERIVAKNGGGGVKERIVAKRGGGGVLTGHIPMLVTYGRIPPPPGGGGGGGSE